MTEESNRSTMRPERTRVAEWSRDGCRRGVSSVYADGVDVDAVSVVDAFIPTLRGRGREGRERQPRSNNSMTN